MLISHEKKFLFIHVQKTAGSSLRLLLQNNIPNLNQYMGTHDHALWAKRQADFVWDDYYKVAFVRNPWDRLVSWYYMIRQQSDGVEGKVVLNDLWSYVLETSCDFESFVKCCTATIDDIDGRKSFMFNQLDYMTDESGMVIVDFIGKFESLERDVQAVADRLSLGKVKIPHYNVSNRSHYRSYYNDETRELVAERYARDIEFFQYKF